MVMIKVNFVKGPADPNPFLSGHSSGMYGPFSEEEVETRMTSLGWEKSRGRIGTSWEPPDQKGQMSHSLVNVLPIDSQEFPPVEAIYQKRPDTGGF